MKTRLATIVAALLSTLLLTAPSLVDAQSPIVASHSIGPSTEEAGTTDPFPSPRFGRTIAIDGRIAMASIPGELASEPNELGRVAVFEYIDDEWQRIATLLGTEDSGGDFGRAIDIESRRAVILASKALYLYERRGRSWVQSGKVLLKQSDAVFGTNVELEEDLIIARVSKPSGEGRPGSAVHVYERKNRRSDHPYDASVLTRTAVIRPRDGLAGESFGTDLAMDDHLLVVGAPDGDNIPGAAYVYVRFGHRWFQLDRLTASDGAVGDGFGSSVAIRNAVIVVGAPNADLGVEDDGYGRPHGNVYVFLPYRRGWYQSQRLNDPAHEVQVRDLGHEVRIGRGLLAVRVRDTRGLIRGEDRVLVYDWVDGLFQFPQEVARYEGFIPDMDIAGRRLIFSRHDAGVFNYYVRGSASIYVFGRRL